MPTITRNPKSIYKSKTQETRGASGLCRLRQDPETVIAAALQRLQKIQLEAGEALTLRHRSSLVRARLCLGKPRPQCCREATVDSLCAGASTWLGLRAILDDAENLSVRE